MGKRVMSFADAVREAHVELMSADPTVICYGLGVTDPKAIFGTTTGLLEAFGSERVFDVPTSEAALTGAAVGAALGGLRPIVSHQRLDFFLLAMDQLVNAAAKWHYMFGSQTPVPITIRLIVGRGWGQGPTHSQNLHAWFAHIPGLKVVMPSNAADAKGLLIAAVRDPNPVLVIEHRWLHQSNGDVPAGLYETPIGVANRIFEGDDVTVVATSIMATEALRAAQVLHERGVHCDVIDLRSVRPIDWDTISESLDKTRRLVVVDSGYVSGSIAGAIVSRLITTHFDRMLAAPRVLAMPDVPEPTSFGLTRDFHTTAAQIAAAVGELCGSVVTDHSDFRIDGHHDIPGDWFRGPF
jgi:pyruvate/2-oxoglutarate/acetoin dehydrogenase E1 component